VRDFLQRDLEVGDYVVFVGVLVSHSPFVIGKITGFTAKQIRVSFINQWDGTNIPKADHSLRFPNSVIYIEPREATAYKLRTGLL